MPEQDGRLTKDEKDAVIRKIMALWKTPLNCPVCGDPNWIIGDHLVQPVTLGAGQSIMLGGVGYPH
jgi:hypothetical protein